MENYITKHDKLARHLSMTVEEVSEGYARVSMPITDNHKNGMGMAHGGVIFALADVAFGSAANATTPNGVVSLSSNISFLRPGMVSPLVAEARIIRAGQHISSYDVQIFDGSGALVAKCMASGFLTDIPLPQ